MFRNWCYKNKFNNASSLSHVLMDKGVLSIPFDRLDDFYTKCVECINSGEKIYVVEQKTPFYNFFVDVDFKDEEALGLEQIKNISKIICDKVKSLGGKDCIISVAEPKKVQNNLIKTGIHLNWFGFVVDQEGALSLREHIVSTLKTAYGGQDWNDIIDVAVYGNLEKQTAGAGFRMPWSHKMGKHDVCGGTGCEGCDNGKVTQSPYLPVYKYIHGPLSMIQEVSQEPTVEMLKLTTVRTDCEAPTRIKPLSKAKSNLIKEGGFTKHQTKNEVIDSEIQAYLETFIRKNMEGQQNARITKMFKHKKCYLISTTSHYCENLGREHNSNHIWFFLSNNLITQKCFCDCETSRGRRSGFCKDFSGRRHVIPDKLIEKLYTKEDNIPEKKEVKTQVIKKNDLNDLLSQYINKNMYGQKDVEVIGVLKKGKNYTVETTSMFCEKANEEHDFCIPFNIEKDVIKCACPCKSKKFSPRGHILYSKIVDKLNPAKKK